MSDEDVRRALRRATDLQLVEAIKRRAGDLVGDYKYCTVSYGRHGSGNLLTCKAPKVDRWCPSSGVSSIGICVSCCAEHGCRNSKEIT